MAGKFLDPLRLAFLGSGKWSLTDEFDYHLGTPDSKELVRVPAGFVTDFASIPRGLWNLLPPTGDYGKAAVVHDWLYQIRRVDRLVGQQYRPILLRSVPIYVSRLVERREADAILNEAMTVLNVGRLTRWVIYTGVRAGGWLTWRRHRAVEAT